MANGVEAELKFNIDDEALRKLMRFKALDGHVVTVQGAKNVVTHYFDTEDHALRANGISLRLRRSGHGGEQTVKVGGSFSLGMAERPEHTVAYRGLVPDIGRFQDVSLKERLAELIGDSPLVPLFTVKMKRKIWRVTSEEGDVLEFSVDNGEVTAGEQCVPVLEAEFELISGDRRTLFDVAKATLRGLGFSFSTKTKADLGYDLIDGAPVTVGLPALADRLDLQPDLTVEEAMRMVLRSCVAQISANVVAVRSNSDPEGPHQLRVGLRRLRSALRVFSRVIDGAARARLNEDARWLASEVGATRDLDVLRDELVAPLSRHMPMDDLLAALTERFAAARTRLDKALADERTGALLIDLIAFTEGRGWLSSSDLGQSALLVRPIGEFAEASIRKLRGKVAAMGADPDSLSPEERHELRKKFKALRYGLEFFSSLLGKSERRDLLPKVKAAQDVLGKLNDIQMVHGLLDGLVAKGAKAGAVERQIGFCLGWHAARAQDIWDDRKDDVRL